MVIFLNEPKLFSFWHIKCFEVVLSKNDCSICTQLNGFKYWYVIPIIYFNINHLFSHIEIGVVWFGCLEQFLVINAKSTFMHIKNSISNNSV